MKIEIKKTYLIFILVLVGIGIVFAAKPAPVGHLINEIETCPNVNDILKMDSTGKWDCVTDGGGGGSGAVDSVSGASGGGVIANPTTGNVIVKLDVCTAQAPYLEWSESDNEWKCSTGTGGVGGGGDNLGNHQATQNLIMSNNRITSLASPSSSSDAATKSYVDSVAGGGGGGGLRTYIGATSTSYDGVGVGGYSGGNTLCNLAFSGSRMCMAADFINGRPKSEGWYSTFAGTQISGQNLQDCQGWTSNAGTQYGPMWDAGSNNPSNAVCSAQKKILCCN